MRRPLYYAIAALPFGLLLSIPILETVNKTVPLTLSELTLMFLIYAYLRWGGLSSQPLKARVPDCGVIMLFAGWALFTLSAAVWRFGLDLGQTIVSGLYLARWGAYALIYFAACEAIVDRPAARKIVKWLMSGGVAVAAFGLLQSIFFPANFALWLHPGARPYIDYDPQGHRLVSSFLDPNMAAGYILIFALLALAFYVQGFKKWLWPLLVLLAALLATLSRGGLLGFLVGALFLFKSSHSRRGRILKAGIVVMMICLALYPLLAAGIRRAQRFNLSSGDSIALRLLWWSNDLKLVARYPVAGIGFNTIGYVVDRYEGETGASKAGGAVFGIAGDLLMILMLTGIVGLLIYLWMLKKMLVPLWRLGDSGLDSWDRAFGRGAFAGSIGAITSSCFATIIVYPQIMAALWVLWAVGGRLYGDAVVRRRGTSTIVPRPKAARVRMSRPEPAVGSGAA